MNKRQKKKQRRKKAEKIAEELLKAFGFELGKAREEYFEQLMNK